ncbi:spherulation-specific family 4 protein, partial [Escherichia coli]|nr:spherulation-specific family 4 protein [Escherichia coli]
MKTIQTGGRSPASATLAVASQEGNAKRRFARAAYAAFALVSGALMGASHARAEGLLVPSYIYPAGTGATQWSALATAATSVPTTVILNPNSGPGTTQDANYVA